MNDGCWRMLLLLELQGKLTRVVTTSNYDGVLAWAKENTRPKFDYDNNLIVYNIDGNNRRTYSLGNNKTVELFYLLQEILVIYADLGSPRNLVWFQDPKKAVLFRLST